MKHKIKMVAQNTDNCKLWVVSTSVWGETEERNMTNYIREPKNGKQWLTIEYSERWVLLTPIVGECKKYEDNVCR